MLDVCSLVLCEQHVKIAHIHTNAYGKKEKTLPYKVAYAITISIYSHHEVDRIW